MAQVAKFIDINRTYLPMDPNAFPSSMHGTGREDSPEERIPVMAIEAKNILPTGHGYMSYFGIGSELGINALPSFADHIFIYQNTQYENIVIALTDDGLYFKLANTSGAWTLGGALPASPSGEHYEWSYVVISQILYCYRQNAAHYFKVESHISLGITVTAVVPNTLNMAGQMGIFRAGGRLAFWDSDDSFAWSNQDDYADFVPSLQTLAGSTKFIAVNGRVVTVEAHGDGFIIYCTKSIIYVIPSTDSTFQWIPKVVFPNNGIVYRKQVTKASPDTVHFVFTLEGIYKIEMGKEELILVELSDLLQRSKKPVYLSLLEGRYLCLEIMDQDFLPGLVHFTEGSTGEFEYYFPGYEQDLDKAIADWELTGTDLCQIAEGIGKGVYGDLPAFPDQKPGSTIRPLWVAYLSNSGRKDGTVVAWNNSPVTTVDPNGVEKNMCPVGNNNKTSQLSTDGTNKTSVAGDDAYLDGSGWTMSRFVSAQEGIWKLEQEELEKFFNTVESRQFTVQDLTPSWHDAPQAESNVVDKQLIGTYASEFTKGFFGFSKCQFWLTRYCIGAREIYRNKRNIITSTDTRVAASPRGFADAYAAHILGGGIIVDASAVSVFSDLIAYAEAGKPPGGSYSLVYYTTPGMGYPATSSYNTATGLYTLYASLNWYNSSGSSTVSTLIFKAYADPPGQYTITTLPVADPVRDVWWQDVGGRYRRDEIMIATNEGKDIPFGPIPDTGYCTLVNWEYTKNDNNKTTASVAACDATASYPPGSSVNQAPQIAQPSVGQDGSFCSIPFEPVLVPGYPDGITEWPSVTIPIPGVNFLLQDGSIAPVNPTMYGFLAYDLHLKKWGRGDLIYKNLINYSPINNARNGVIDYSVFGVKGGVLLGNGKIRLFDQYPEDSYISYGKIGYYRLGKTQVHEFIVHFSELSTGSLEVTASLHGKSPNPTLFRSSNFSGQLDARLTGGFPGSWHLLTVRGNYNINYMEYRALPAGRR